MAKKAFPFPPAKKSSGEDIAEGMKSQKKSGPQPFPPFKKGKGGK